MIDITSLASKAIPNYYCNTFRGAVQCLYHIPEVERMPFQSTRSRLALSEDELNTLRAISKSRTEPSGRVERAKIILEYHGGAAISEIARSHNTNRPKIDRQIDKALQMGAIPSLDDIQRSGRIATITDDAKTWLISMACAKPLDYGYKHEMWTMALLAECARKRCEEGGHPSLRQLSRGTVSKILSANVIKPHIGAERPRV